MWTASWTYDELKASPLLYDGSELYDGNWGDCTLTFKKGNAASTSSTVATYVVTGETVSWVHGNERFMMRLDLVGDHLTFTRDTTLAIAPTPFLVKAWTRQS